MKAEKAMVADDGKPGKSLKETSTEELKATLAKLKPTDPGAEARIEAIKAELKARGDGDMEKAKQPSETTSLTPEKARQMLHERSGGHGRPITEQQRKFFGAVGGHLPAPGSKAKKSMSYEDLDDFLEKAKYTSRKRVGNRWVYKYADDKKKPAAGAASGGPIDEQQAQILVSRAQAQVGGTGTSVTFSDDADAAKKMLDGMPDGTVIARHDRSGAAQTTMAKVKGQWVTAQADTASDDWGDDDDYDVKHVFNAGEMSKIVSRGQNWKDGVVWTPKSAIVQKSMEMDLDDYLEKAATPIGGITPGGYKRVKKDQYVKVTKEEHAAHTAKEKERAGARPIPEPKVSRQREKETIKNLPEPKVSTEGGATVRKYEGLGTIRTEGDRHFVYDNKGIEQGIHYNMYSAQLAVGGMVKSMETEMDLDDYLEKAGPYIGKRGGKWADPEHKIPWKEEGKKKPSGGKAKKLNAKQANALRAAAKFGVVPGGRDATFSMVNKLTDAGLLESSKENPQVYRPTAAGKQALASGSYMPATKTKGGEAPKSGEGVTVKPGMEGKTVKPAGEAAPKAGGGLPEPKIKKIGNATIRDYGDIGLIRSQPGLGHTVLDAEGTEVGEIGEHKSIKAAEKKLMSMKKSLDGIEGLEDWMQKSGGLPTHQQGMGHKKSSTQGASADGGELADVGRTSGSSDSAPGPEQDAQGQLKGVSPGKKEKLSDDDAEETKQMTTHKKPIETLKKSRFPADQREAVAHEHAAAVSRLQKSDDVYVGPNVHPYSHQLTHASGDAEASELVKSEDFYHGGSPELAPSRPIIEQGVLCKSVNAHGCEQTYSAALTSCPGCGAGTVGHRHIPGGPVMGAETTILEKSMGPGPLLRRPNQEPDIKIG